MLSLRENVQLLLKGTQYLKRFPVHLLFFSHKIVHIGGDEHFLVIDSFSVIIDM